MIIRCSEKNRTEVLEYLNSDPIMNLFIIGDIETFGFDKQFQTVFVDKELDVIKTVYLVYRTNLVIGSSTGEIDVSFVKKLVDEYSLTDINGDYRLVAQLDIPKSKLEKCKIATLDKLAVPIDNRAGQLGIEDLDQLVDDCQAIFNRKMDLDQERENFTKGTSCYYGCIVAGKVVSGARTSAHCTGAAMIIGVYTLEPYRNQGYALSCVSKLCADFLEQGKKLCLFYNNPYAGRLYHKLGFEDHGDYGLLRLN